MRRSRCCAWASRDSFRMCVVLCVMAFGWQGLWAGFCFWVCLMTGRVFTAPFSIVFVSQPTSAFLIFFAECSFSCSLSCLKLSSVFSAASCIRPFMCTVAICASITLRMLIIGCVAVVLACSLFSPVDGIVCGFGGWVGLRVGLLPGRTLVGFIPLKFWVCSFCWWRVGVGFGRFWVCWRRASCVCGSVQYWGRTGWVWGFLLIDRLFRLDRGGGYGLLVGFGCFSGKDWS